MGYTGNHTSEDGVITDTFLCKAGKFMENAGYKRKPNAKWAFPVPLARRY